MDIKELERLEELKKFSKIKRIMALIPYFNDFISSRSLLPGTLD